MGGGTRDFAVSWDDHYGRIAYEAYCNHTGWKSLATGQSLPQWEGLKPEIREAWAVSAKALRDHFA